MGIAADEQFAEGSADDNLRSDFEGGSVKLFSNNFTPARSSVEADFTEASFSGYSAASISSSVDATDASVGHVITTSTFAFTHNGGATSETIYGWYMVSSEATKTDGSTTTEVIAYERFATPIDMNVNGDRIEITLEAITEFL